MTALLSVAGLEKTFGSVVAARDISCDIPAGQIVGIIGANGAGKTTFVNMITGYLKPTRGHVRFEDRDITGLPSRDITRLGISRSFQVAQIFPTLTVFENVCTACAVARTGGTLRRILGRRMDAADTVAEAEAMLERFQLAQYRDAEASVLAQGVRKVLDIAMASAGSPRLLMLDEPTSGVSLEERYGLMELIVGALRRNATTVLFVEHDMDIVERFAERVLAFYDGTILADGAPAQVLGAPDVREFITGADIRGRGGERHA